MGLSILTCLDSDHVLTCIISGLLGLLLACVGQDKMYAVQRLTFGSRNLLAGIDMIPVLIGLFAVTEVFKQTDPKKKRLSAEDGISGGRVNTKMPTLKEIWSIMDDASLLRGWHHRRHSAGRRRDDRFLHVLHDGNEDLQVSGKVWHRYH
ncbi:MAG: tripartite tricarboxylate transporter permease [Christensenellales bacterium]